MNLSQQIFEPLPLSLSWINPVFYVLPANLMLLAWGAAEPSFAPDDKAYFGFDEQSYVRMVLIALIHLSLQI